MIRAQIQLEVTLYEQVKQRAKELGCSIAELARMSIKEKLDSDSANCRWAASLKLAGTHRSGLRDLSIKHDAYLADEKW
jgi:post-segregation antitoxin (ccd killing protein)